MAANPLLNPALWFQKAFFGRGSGLSIPCSLCLWTATLWQYVAGLDVFPNALRHTMPRVLAANCIQGAREPEVSSLRVVMVRSHDFLNDLIAGIYARPSYLSKPFGKFPRASAQPVCPAYG